MMERGGKLRKHYEKLKEAAIHKSDCRSKYLGYLLKYRL